MSPGKKKDIALACYAIVSNFFSMMHNPKYRGSQFTWDNFPAMMQTHCEAQIHVYVNRCTDEMKEYAKEYSKDIAAKLVSHLK